MTRVRVGVVDVHVIRVVGKSWRVLVLHRAPGYSRAGAWEAVHGRIEPGESPGDAARRELREETGLEADRLYSVTVNPFFVQPGTVQLAVVFAAFVTSPKVRLGPEHDRAAWLAPAKAAQRCTWPRAGEALAHIRKLMPNGHAGVVDDVLRVSAPAAPARS